MLHFTNMVAAHQNRPAMFRKKPDKSDLEQRAEMCALALALCTELQTQVPITSEVLYAECAAKQSVKSTGTAPHIVMMTHPNHTVRVDQCTNNLNLQPASNTPTTPERPYHPVPYHQANCLTK